MKTDLGKNIRIAQLARRNTLKKISVDTFIMLLLIIDKDLFESWLKTTKSFPELLLRIGDEMFGDTEDCEEPWQRKLCEIITDVAEKYLSSKEWKAAKLGIPKELVVWFSCFLKHNLNKNELNWDGNLFNANHVEAKVAEIGTEIERKSSL